MAWDHTTNPVITRNRLRFSSPDAVYEALEQYGAYLRENQFRLGDEDLEQALAGRNAPLIDLALAKNARSHSLVAQLYKRALAGSGDADYDRAIRLNCLSNRGVMGALYSKELIDPQSPAVNEGHRLALEGDEEELAILMSNPGIRGFLAAVYTRKDWLQDIPDERWRLLVLKSVGNPAINRDDTDSRNPDLLAWDLRKALRGLLGSAPAQPDWVLTLHQLLLELSPPRVWGFDSEQAVIDILERWKGITVKSEFGDREHEGYFTPQPIAEEFRCLVAALYGSVLVDKKLVSVGKPDSDDVALRCAYYGNSAKTVEEMKAAYEKDGDIFTFGALFNNSVMLEPACRAELEAHLTRDTDWLRKKRYKQLQAEHDWFDPRPVSELLEIADTGAAESAVQENPELRALASQMTDLKTQIAGLSKVLVWGLIVILAILVFWRR
ncbi:hypothetical protein AWB68_00501 [Caballeronia choica]|uniref:Uncharacterized protein n=1 Tax=Caballeronia choica TaxID=326476 RepID=A0A158FCM3_9BURK|nr:hypothetical protein [Caballeronia choica]SAL17475.1 hypothetical protein AWB68_00501 [Caballeronia choica]